MVRYLLPAAFAVAMLTISGMWAQIVPGKAF
jgi:hypothetical protein